MDKQTADLANAAAGAFNLQSVVDAVAFARLRLMSTTAIIAELANPDFPGDYTLIKILRERHLTAQDRRCLTSVVMECLSDSFRAQVPVSHRHKLARLLPNMIGLLDETSAREAARGLALHRLATMRAGAMRALRRLGASDEDAGILRTVLTEYRDLDALFLLSHIPGGLGGFTCCELAATASQDRDSYFGAIVLERLARDGALDHTHAVHAHALYYLRAVGRLGDPELLRCVRHRVPTETPEYLSLAASVAGRLGDESLVAIVEIRVSDMLSDGSRAHHAPFGSPAGVLQGKSVSLD